MTSSCGGEPVMSTCGGVLLSAIACSYSHGSNSGVCLMMLRVLRLVLVEQHRWPWLAGKRTTAELVSLSSSLTASASLHQGSNGVALSCVCAASSCIKILRSRICDERNAHRLHKHGYDMLKVTCDILIEWCSRLPTDEATCKGRGPPTLTIFFAKSVLNYSFALFHNEISVFIASRDPPH